MISIITAIYNQLDMNRLYWETIQRNTDGDFELIIIDNNSTDGSREFFESCGERVRVIANKCNYSYPYCQNQGFAIARGDVMAFFNNDMLPSKHWDSRLEPLLGENGREILSLASNDRCLDNRTTKRLQRSWKRVKYPVMALFGQRNFALRLMLWLCYGNWDRYCESVYERNGLSFTDGFSGSAIVMTRRAVEVLGAWEPSQQAADFHLFYQSCERAEKYGDMKPIAVVNGIFSHHYRRLTLYQKYPPFEDRDQLRSLSDMWSAEQMERYDALMSRAAMSVK